MERTGGKSAGSQGEAERAVEQAVRSYLTRGITPAAAPGSAGTAVSGVHCGPRVRQVPWSANAPSGEPAYRGNHGGYRDCEGGASFPANDASACGSPHTQLHCFGQ